MAKAIQGASEVKLVGKPQCNSIEDFVTGTLEDAKLRMEGLRA